MASTFHSQLIKLIGDKQPAPIPPEHRFRNFLHNAAKGGSDIADEQAQIHLGLGPYRALAGVGGALGLFGGLSAGLATADMLPAVLPAIEVPLEAALALGGPLLGARMMMRAVPVAASTIAEKVEHAWSRTSQRVSEGIDQVLHRTPPSDSSRRRP